MQIVNSAQRLVEMQATLNKHEKYCAEKTERYLELQKIQKNKIRY